MASALGNARNSCIHPKEQFAQLKSFRNQPYIKTKCIAIILFLPFWKGPLDLNKLDWRRKKEKFMNLPSTHRLRGGRALRTSIPQCLITRSRVPECNGHDVQLKHKDCKANHDGWYITTKVEVKDDEVTTKIMFYSKHDNWKKHYFQISHGLRKQCYAKIVQALRHGKLTITFRIAFSSQMTSLDDT